MKDILHHLLDSLVGLGYWGIMLGLAVEVIPSEVVLAYAGFLVYQGKINFAEAVLFGTAGILIAQAILYWIGKYGGRPFVEKFGKYLLLKPRTIDKAEAWFNRFGPGIVFSARFLPVLRQAVSIPAGMARMSFASFMFYTVLATVPWCILFIWLGEKLGENWEQIDEKAKPVFTPILIAGIVLGVLYFWWKRRRGAVRSGQQEAWKAGHVGEKNVAHQLRFLGSEYQVLNGRRVRSRSNVQEIDHLVVGPNGLFHIETKNWSGEIRFTEHGVERSKEGHHEDPTAQLYRHDFVLKELLRANKLQTDIVGVLCFAHPEATLVGTSPAFLTVQTDRLVHAIKTHPAKQKLAPETVKQIADLLKEHSEPSA